MKKVAKNAMPVAIAPVRDEVVILTTRLSGIIL